MVDKTYNVLWSYDLDKLIKAVNEAHEAGWAAVGGIEIAVWRPSSEATLTPSGTFYQAVVKVLEPKDLYGPSH